VGVVRAPDGREWSIERQWRSAEGDDSIVAGRRVGAAILLALIVVVVVVSLAHPELLAVGELVVLALGLVAHVAIVRPWAVVARSGDEEHRWRVRGLHRSSRAVADAARRLRTGLPVAGWSPGSDV
jgi:hypothetical protein